MNGSASASTTSTSTSAADRLAGCGAGARHAVLRDVVGVERRGPDLYPVLLEDPHHRHVEACVRGLRDAARTIVNDGLGLHDVSPGPLDGLNVPLLGAVERHREVVPLQVRADEDPGSRVVGPLLVDIRPGQCCFATFGVSRDVNTPRPYGRGFSLDRVCGLAKGSPCPENVDRTDNVGVVFEPASLAVKHCL